MTQHRKINKINYFCQTIVASNEKNYKAKASHQTVRINNLDMIKNFSTQKGFHPSLSIEQAQIKITSLMKAVKLENYTDMIKIVELIDVLRYKGDKNVFRYVKEFKAILLKHKFDDYKDDTKFMNLVTCISLIYESNLDEDLNIKLVPIIELLIKKITKKEMEVSLKPNYLDIDTSLDQSKKTGDYKTKNNRYSNMRDTIWEPLIECNEYIYYFKDLLTRSTDHIIVDMPSNSPYNYLWDSINSNSKISSNNVYKLIDSMTLQFFLSFKLNENKNQATCEAFKKLEKSIIDPESILLFNERCFSLAKKVLKTNKNVDLRCKLINAILANTMYNKKLATLGINSYEFYYCLIKDVSVVLFSFNNIVATTEEKALIHSIMNYQDFLKFDNHTKICILYVLGQGLFSCQQARRSMLDTIISELETYSRYNKMNHKALLRNLADLSGNERKQRYLDYTDVADRFLNIIYDQKDNKYFQKHDLDIIRCLYNIVAIQVDYTNSKFEAVFFDFLSKYNNNNSKFIELRAMTTNVLFCKMLFDNNVTAFKRYRKSLERLFDLNLKDMQGFIRRHLNSPFFDKYQINVLYQFIISCKLCMNYNMFNINRKCFDDVFSMINKILSYYQNNPIHDRSVELIPREHLVQVVADYLESKHLKYSKEEAMLKIYKADLIINKEDLNIPINEVKDIDDKLMDKTQLKKIYIEINGKIHFSKVSRGLKSSSIIKRVHLYAFGYSVVHMDFKTYLPEDESKDWLSKLYFKTYVENKLKLGDEFMKNMKLFENS